ncbi:MAG: bifunctional 5,10-methylene-tetrahydrofolate dehydrogenase/5,10-methylene-tetrahydrofolate cyclohydrolase [Candidatus Cloacimonadota bacterium]|nr:MAG: bifunctional 5,10-methylene-tetrahydrofolate dehydrogenase/5,10-methylene-tetrahydrofolate cyclohydrolase [Candidatus Cloacimonadota bacterium]
MKKDLIGKPVANSILKNLKEKIYLLKQKDIFPNLAIFIIGQDPSAQYYLNNQIKKGAEIGLNVEAIRLPVNISESEFITQLEMKNNDPKINGIMLQMPFPEQFDQSNIINHLNPEKDVDGFHPINIGNLVLGRDALLPNTPAAILELIKYYKIETNSKNIVVLGRSNIVGKPIANLLIQKNNTGNATVTICHSHTKNLPEITKHSDILITAIGKPLFIKKDMVSEKSIIIDVGINKLIDKKSKRGYRYVGDVDYEDVYEKIQLITPVPGGVGTITTAMSLANTVKATLKQFGY